MKATVVGVCEIAGEAKLLITSLFGLSGMETEVTQTCDSTFFGRYWYNVTSDETTWYCNETSLWDVCTDNAIMKFSYAQCPTVIAESSTVLHCPQRNFLLFYLY